ncbi:Glycerol-3-phosphate cytidylyltransferase [compost metagenome]
MSTVITYGTFDLFHVGHLKLLRRLRSMGDRLVVGCSTDEFNSLKGKKTVIPFEHRIEVLQGCRYVDHVLPERSWDQKIDDIRREKASLFAMGDDWVGKFDYLLPYCDVIYLPRTENISSTEIRELIRSNHVDHLRRIEAAAENLLKTISDVG